MSERTNVTLLPSSLLQALDAEADIWAGEINLSAWIAKMTSDPRSQEKMDAFARQCFVEGAYRGALNVIDGKALQDSIEAAKDANATDLQSPAQ